MSLVAGIGFSSRASAAEIATLVLRTLDAAGLPLPSLSALATIDRRAADPVAHAAAAALDVPLLAFSPDALARFRVPSPSAAVACHAGVAGVAEAAAMACGPLLVSKQRSAHATCAIARKAEP